MANRKSRRRFIAPLIFIAVLIGFTALLIGVFKLGMMVALASAGGAIIVYQIPAIIYDWPRFTLEDLLSIIAGIWDWFLNLFDL